MNFFPHTSQERRLPGAGMRSLCVKAGEGKAALLCFPSAAACPLLFIHLQMLSGSRGGGHPVVKPGSTKHETGSPATARAEVAAAAAATAAVASVQGKELAKANSRRRTAVTMRSKETKARRACSVLLSLSVLPGDRLFGGFLCEIMPPPPL